MLAGIKVDLKPLRKNGKLASYIVLELNKDGSQQSVTYYETIKEALMHAMLKGNGDILSRGGKQKCRLIAFFSPDDKRMRFGFGARACERSTLASDFWWAF
jgi:hypothetical protein